MALDPRNKSGVRTSPAAGRVPSTRAPAGSAIPSPLPPTVATRQTMPAHAAQSRQPGTIIPATASPGQVTVNPNVRRNVRPTSGGLNAPGALVMPSAFTLPATRGSVSLRTRHPSPGAAIGTQNVKVATPSAMPISPTNPAAMGQASRSMVRGKIAATVPSGGNAPATPVVAKHLANQKWQQPALQSKVMPAAGTSVAPIVAPQPQPSFGISNNKQANYANRVKWISQNRDRVLNYIDYGDLSTQRAHIQMRTNQHPGSLTAMLAGGNGNTTPGNGIAAKMGVAGILMGVADSAGTPSLVVSAPLT